MSLTVATHAIKGKETTKPAHNRTPNAIAPRERAEEHTKPLKERLHVAWLVLAIAAVVGGGFVWINSENNRLEQKIENDINRLEEKIEASRQETKNDILRLEDKIETDINRLEAKIESDINRLEGDINRVEEKIDRLIEHLIER